MFLCSSFSKPKAIDSTISNQKEEMEEEMLTIMMGSSPNLTNLVSWKFYDNPHYHTSPHKPHHHHHHHPHHQYACISESRSSHHACDFTDRDVNLSDLDSALAEIKNLRAELDIERRIRLKLESVNNALMKENKRLAAEIVYVHEESERAEKEAEDERRMLRMAEAMREERVHMKLSEARILMEEKIKEMTVVPEKHRHKMIVINDDENRGLHKKEKDQVENPHIKRGIKGMEFPKAVRIRGGAVSSSPSSREGRGGGTHLGSNLECQRAQLRVLMRQKNPVGSGIIGAAEHLVM